MRVFVFGAGASIHVGYPLTGELMPRLIEWLRKNPESVQPENGLWPDPDELTTLFPSSSDIEEVVTELEDPRYRDALGEPRPPNARIRRRAKTTIGEEQS